MQRCVHTREGDVEAEATLLFGVVGDGDDGGLQDDVGVGAGVDLKFGFHRVVDDAGGQGLYDVGHGADIFAIQCVGDAGEQLLAGGAGTGARQDVHHHMPGLRAGGLDVLDVRVGAQTVEYIAALGAGGGEAFG